MINKNIALLGVGFATVLGLRKFIHRKSEEKFNFLRKVVFISGASRGLGYVLAKQLAVQNARLVICARNEEELERARHELQHDYAAEVLAIACDITDELQVQSAIDQTIEHYGRIDVLVNNAGDITVSPLENNTLEDFDRMMQLYFYGPLFTMKTAIPFMKQQGEGRIVNICSIGGKISVPHLLPYCSGKFALSGLSEGMAAELKKENIQITTIYPGLMRTGSPRNVEVKGKHELEYRWFKLGDSLPGVSVNAENAAAQILRACRRGARTLIISLPAKLAIAVHGVAPGMVIRVNELVNRMMPNSAEVSKGVRGYETKFEKRGSWLTKLTDRAAERNFNVLPGTREKGTQQP